MTKYIAKHTTRIDSEEVQGAGSYIVIQRPTIKQARQNKRTINKLTRQLARFERQLERAINSEHILDDEIEKLEGAVDVAEDLLETEGTKAFSSYVLEWNWTNGNDEPLPQPHDNGESFELLHDVEFQFIVDQFVNSEETKKN